MEMIKKRFGKKVKSSETRAKETKTRADQHKCPPPSKHALMPNATITYFKLYIDPRRDDDARYPMSSYRCMLKTYLNVNLSSLAQVKIRIKILF